MKIGIYKGVDALTNALLKYHNKDKLNELLATCFPSVFDMLYTTLIRHLFTIPLPIRDKFLFALIYDNQMNVIGFGMMDYSNPKQVPIIKNVCRNTNVQWRGIGKHILKALESYSKQELGIKILGLNAGNTKLIRYYKQFGWILREGNYMQKNLQ